MASNIVLSQVGKLGEMFGIHGNEQELVDTLKLTAFSGTNVSDSQMVALMIIANQYNLNPFTKEIYAFPSKGGITPIVGVDGWARILNENPQFDGIEFDLDDEKCTCRIYRKDRSKPISVTEYMSECWRDSAGPWKTHPKRMLRHKAMIQCARLAFGFTGIYDQDEADRIAEAQREPINVTPKQNVIDVKSVELITDEQLQTLQQLIEVTGTNVEKALAYYGADSIERLSTQSAVDFIGKLNRKLDARETASQNNDENLGDNIPL